MENKTKLSPLSAATTVIFCLLIAVLSVASMVNPVRDFSEVENRELAQFPEWSADAFFKGEWMMDYESFITDQFVWRDGWITMKSYAELALGKKELKDIFFCDDGYFIQNIHPDKEQLAKNLESLHILSANLKGKTNLRILLAPTASLILADKLPTGAPVWNQSAMLDEAAKIEGFVDIRDAMSAAADENKLYYKTDHHWTAQGAYVAYTELMKSLGLTPATGSFGVVSNRFEGTLTAKINFPSEGEDLTIVEPIDGLPKLKLDFNLGQRTSDSLYVAEKLETRDKYGYFLGQNDPLVDITTDAGTGRTLLLVKDSYAHSMLGMLTAHYDRIVVLDLRHFNGGVLQYCETYGFEPTDTVILYNADSFAEDRYLSKLEK